MKRCCRKPLLLQMIGPRPIKIVPKPIDFHASYCLIFVYLLLCVCVFFMVVAAAAFSVLYQHHLLVNKNIVFFLSFFRPIRDCHFRHTRTHKHNETKTFHSFRRSYHNHRVYFSLFTASNVLFTALNGIGALS